MDSERTTVILRRAVSGDASAERQLVERIYDELRAAARHELRRWPWRDGVETTALVHEVYVRLLHGGERDWHDRRHFLRAAAMAMHRYMIDLQRRPSGLPVDTTVLIDRTDEEGDFDRVDFLALEEHLGHLERTYPRQADVLRTRYFLGLSVRELAEEFQLSKATVERDLLFARTWLCQRMEE